MALQVRAADVLTKEDICLLAVARASVSAHGEQPLATDEYISLLVAQVLREGKLSEEGWHWHFSARGWVLVEVVQFDEYLRSNAWAAEDSPLRLTPAGRRESAEMIQELLSQPEKQEAVKRLAGVLGLDLKPYVEPPARPQCKEDR